MAEGTSFALPTPNPTTPWPSPTTTSALKLRFLPPFTTLVTRLMETTVSLMSSWPGSIRSRVRILEIQSCFAGGICDSANAAVIQKPASVEHDVFDALADRPLGDGRADGFGTLDVAAADALGEARFERGIDARRRRERLAAEIVDHLRVDVLHAPEHAQARTLFRAGDPLALTQLDPPAAVVFG